MPIREVVEQLVHLVRPETRPLFGALASRPIEPVRAADIIKTYEKIGWQAATPLEKGLALTADWYRTQAEIKRSTLRTIVPGENESQKYGSSETHSRS
jgi:nucleoside-diphosphate-sugar epimerase